MCPEPRRLSLLFLSTGSACPALLAEAWARAMAGNALGLAAAALADVREPHLAEQALAETGLCLSGLAYRGLAAVQASRADLVVTLSEGEAVQPVALPCGAGRIDWRLPRRDPGLAALRPTQTLLRLKVAALLKELGVENRLEAAPDAAPGLPFWPGAGFRPRLPA